ncbi:MAG: hypothetical protein IKD44_02020 [Lentisphaeria bacterium]|nr:hypothetical protein [Lentisphaeria bacterium]
MEKHAVPFFNVSRQFARCRIIRKKILANALRRKILHYIKSVGTEWKTTFAAEVG